MYKLVWLADVLRSGGLKVVEEPGWQTRGRGDMGEARGVLCHHTAGPLKGNTPSLRIVRDGRDNLPGPLSHLFLARDGTFHVLAAGRCNHAGEGRWQGVTTGNSSFIGIEAENAGTLLDPWPVAQLDAYAHGVAAILAHIGADSVMAAGHKEYATPRGRKIDPTFDMVAFREHVALAMRGLSNGQPARTVDPERAMLRKGDSGASVRELQTLLSIRADGDFGPVTEAAVRGYQSAHGLKPDGLVGPRTWAAILEGRG